ncbi:MAG: NAD(P)H-quinone oxidoreductase [Kineosporiaceae bacterium]
MRAVLVQTPGGPQHLTLGDVPDPQPAPGEVVLDVVATAVNRADVLQRQGYYPPPPGASEVLGLEASGRVRAVGDGVEGWEVGQPACALLAGGGYAEQVAVPVGQLMPVPAGLDLVDAASLPEVAATVWSNVVMLAGLRPDETLLVHGGAGGIGTFAIQLARAIGARVAVTAGSAAKLQACADLGAQVLVDYRTEDFVDAVLRATDGRGADVVLDAIGGAYLARNVEVLAVHGRLVVIGLQGGRRAELDLAALMAKRAAVLATTLRARPLGEKAAICAGVVQHVWPLVADGVIRPVVHARLPWTQVAAAHELLERSEHVGKVVLVVRPE